MQAGLLHHLPDHCLLGSLARVHASAGKEK